MQTYYSVWANSKQVHTLDNRIDWGLPLTKKSADTVDGQRNSAGVGYMADVSEILTLFIFALT
jgi:hypothetical protein